MLSLRLHLWSPPKSHKTVKKKKNQKKTLKFWHFLWKHLRSLCSCVHIMYHCVYMYIRGQPMGSQVFLSTMWLLEIKLRLSGLKASAFNCWAVLLVLNQLPLLFSYKPIFCYRNISYDSYDFFPLKKINILQLNRGHQLRNTQKGGAPQPEGLDTFKRFKQWICLWNIIL